MKPTPGTTTMLEPALLATIAAPTSLDLATAGMASQLAAAQAIQRSLLPTEFPEIRGFNLAAFCQSAGALGGDFYDGFALDRERVLLVIADVMGTGVPAALFASSLRMLIRSLASRTASVSEVMFRINQEMFYELSSVDMFITAQLALVDTKRGVLQVASAGHCPVVLATHQGQTQAIAPEGLPLGIQANAHFEEEVISLPDCKCMFLYTDGVTEACDGHGTLFGQENLERWLSKHAAGANTARELRDAFLAELVQFQGQPSSQDDQTLVVLASKDVPTPGEFGTEIIQCAA